MSRPVPSGVDHRKSWIAVDYVSLLASQAGYAWGPVPDTKDVHSFDGTVTVWSGGAVSVQVKGKGPHFTRSTSYPIEAAWRRNWVPLHQPAYFVVVTVPHDQPAGWVSHGDPRTHETLLSLSAYWTRIDTLDIPNAKSIQVKASSRLTLDTFDQWRDDYLAFATAGFTGTPLP